MDMHWTIMFQSAWTVKIHHFTQVRHSYQRD